MCRFSIYSIAFDTNVMCNFSLSNEHLTNINFCYWICVFWVLERHRIAKGNWVNKLIYWKYWKYIKNMLFSLYGMRLGVNKFVIKCETNVWLWLIFEYGIYFCVCVINFYCNYCTYYSLCMKIDVIFELRTYMYVMWLIKLVLSWCE